MDSVKSVHIISSYKLLSFLGDMGGFGEAIHIVFSLFGSYFSAQLFRTHKIQYVFKAKKVSVWHSLFEPVAKYCCCSSIQKTQSLIEKGNDKLDSLLEI